MKLMWFHLMPYTELPEDFNRKHPSVWVDIHSSLFDPKRAHHMYNDFMDELEYAAELGYDAICVNEHHSNGRKRQRTWQILLRCSETIAAFARVQCTKYDSERLAWGKNNKITPALRKSHIAQPSNSRQG